MVLAHFAIVYVIACLTYCILTFRMGTPFKDSLTSDQKKIKEESSQKRGRMFLIGIIVGFITVHVVKPFTSSRFTKSKIIF